MKYLNSISDNLNTIYESVRKKLLVFYPTFVYCPPFYDVMAKAIAMEVYNCNLEFLDDRIEQYEIHLGAMLQPVNLIITSKRGMRLPEGVSFGCSWRCGIIKSGNVQNPIYGGQNRYMFQTYIWRLAQLYAFYQEATNAMDAMMCPLAAPSYEILQSWAQEDGSFPPIVLAERGLGTDLMNEYAGSFFYSANVAFSSLSLMGLAPEDNSLPGSRGILPPASGFSTF